MVINMKLIIIILILIILFLLYGYFSNYNLSTTTYEISTEGKAPVSTWVLLTDLHCCKYGKEYDRLLSAIDEAHPDGVLITGDMVIKHISTSDEKCKRVIRLLENIASKYPIYYADGNHEPRMKDQDRFIEELRRIGINYLDNSYIDLDNINESDIVNSGSDNTLKDNKENNNKENKLTKSKPKIYGLNLPLEYYKRNTALTIKELKGFLGDKPNDEKYIILLAHDPTYAEVYTEWGADLTLCGHLHGGIMRLPHFGGVISPGFRFFPKYDAGRFDMDGRTVIVSRGLGTHHLKFRFFNRPELVIIKLL